MMTPAGSGKGVDFDTSGLAFTYIGLVALPVVLGVDIGDVGGFESS